MVCHMSLSKTLDFCRDAAALEGNQPYTNLKQYVLSKSPSKTVYILEVSNTCMSICLSVYLFFCLYVYVNELNKVQE